jgi:hypothetical protein
MKVLKQTNVIKEKEIDGNKFYIKPFSAYTSANLIGEIGGVIAPVLAGVLPLVGSDVSDVMNMDVSAFSTALSSLSGDKLETVLKKLLTKHQKIAVLLKDETDPVTLDDDLVNEIFCGSAQDMFILAFEVIQANFGGFFEKIGSQFGLRKATAPTLKTQ